MPKFSEITQSSDITTRDSFIGVRNNSGFTDLLYPITMLVNYLKSFFVQTGDGIAPTFTAGSGAGTSPTISILDHSDDTSVRISINIGTSPAANSAIVTINLHTAQAHPPNIICSASDTNSVALYGPNQVFAFAVSNSQIRIESGNTPLTASAGYIFTLAIFKTNS